MKGLLRSRRFLETLPRDMPSIACSLAGLGSLLVVGSRVGRPQGEIVAQQLHDQRAVLVAVLVQRVQLSNGIVESLKSR